MLIHNLFLLLENTINTYQLLILQFITLFLKILLTSIFVHYSNNNKSSFFLRNLLLLFFLSELFSNATWFLENILVYYPLGYYLNFFRILTRLGWAFYILGVNALSIFIESLSNCTFYLSLRHKFFLGVSSLLSLYFIYSAFIVPSYNTDFIIMMKLATIYYLILLLISSSIIIYKLKTITLPFILKKQIVTFIKYFIAPYIVLELFTHNFFLPYSWFNAITPFPNENAALAALSSLFTTYMFYFCMTRLMRMRFLNGNDKVTSKNNLISTDTLAYLLDRARRISGYDQLQVIAHDYLEEVLYIDPKQVTVCVGHYDIVLQQETKSLDYLNKSTTLAFFQNSNEFNRIPAFEYLQQNIILVRDELEFTHFYDPQDQYATLIQLLDDLGAAVFLPFFEKDRLFGGIIIASHEKEHRLYVKAEQHQLQSFGSFINKLLIESNFYSMEARLIAAHQTEQTLQHVQKQLSCAHEVIGEKQQHQCYFGLVLYKDKELAIGWPETEKVLGFPLEQKYHPLCAILKKTGQAVYEHRNIEYAYYNNHKGQELVITGLPMVHHSNIAMIFITPRTPSEKMNTLLLVLNNPADWQYVIYLETTAAGRMINTLLPGNGKMLLNFKVALMKATISRKPLLLQASDADLQAMIDVIHHASGAQALEYLTLTHAEKDKEIAEQLFGINPLIMGSKARGLLETLNNGIVCIENIHLLSGATQKMLADFIRSGSFKQLYGTRSIQSAVRIVCTTHASLEKLVEQGVFDTALAESLLPAKLEMPSVHELLPQEFNEFAECHWQQIVKDYAHMPLLMLTDDDKHELHEQHAGSFTELKNNLARLLKQKLAKNKFDTDVAVDNNDISLKEIIAYAAQLGKDALKDEKILRGLWDKYHNQSKIAQLLGVHRSSVMRRLRDLKIALVSE